MQLLRLNFLIYTVGGIWRPIAWSSSCAKLLYNAFTFCTIVPMYFLVLTQFMDLILVVDNMDDFTTNSLMFMTIVVVCCKATIAVIRRSKIIDLVQILSRDPCKPQNADEAAIQSKFDEFIRSYSIKYSLLCTSSVTGVTIRAVLNVMQGILPHRVWLPYDTNLSMIFWITSIHQIVSTIFACIINVGTETLVFGLFLQTCAQLEIFERRLHKLVISKTAARFADGRKCSSASHKEEIISRYIRHHLSIYEYAKTVNSVFNQVLFFQFFGSILILCTSVYYLSSHIMESEAATMIIYTICMFVQIFVYCWSGNEVILKVGSYLHSLFVPTSTGESGVGNIGLIVTLTAAMPYIGEKLNYIHGCIALINSVSIGDAMYHTDWPLLTISEKKDLLMIMKRSTIPIKFTSSFLITLSLQSYSSILKTSYSAFNVLQQS